MYIFVIYETMLNTIFVILEFKQIFFNIFFMQKVKKA